MEEKMFVKLTEFVRSYMKKFDNNENFCWEDVRDAIRAGAEWMAGQGVSFDTEMSLLDSFGFQIGWPEDTSIFDCFNPGDKVVVQIRKK